MTLAIKELIILLLICVGVFRLAEPVARLYCPIEDFSRRRKAWIVLTITIFLAPNFWVFLFVAAPILLILGKKDSNPGAAFLFLLSVVPPISVRLPMFGISFLIDLNFQLLLAFCILTPAAWRLWKDRTRSRIAGLFLLDVCLLAYCILTAFLFVQPEIGKGILMQPTFTDCLRRLFVSFFGLYIPYFVISRTSASRAATQDMLASLSIKCAVLAAVAIFEGARHWLLYGELLSRWGIGSTAYLSRGGDIRAMASTGHPLSLGYLLAVGFGLWLYLQRNVNSRMSRWGINALFALGLFADYSRGPWAGAILTYFVFAAVGPRAVPKLLKAVAGISILGFAVAFSPLGKKVVRVIPYFGGSVDTDTIVYRQRLFERSWQIIMEHPWFGDQQALLKMEELRQGEGIIDLVNGFVTILLSNGFVGLSLFLSFVVIGLIKSFKLSAATTKSDLDLSYLGASLVACMLGSVLMMWLGGLIDMMTCVLVGFMSAYVQISHLPSGLPSIGLVRSNSQAALN